MLFHMKKGIILLLLLTGCTFSSGVEITDLKGKTIGEVEDVYGRPVVVRYEGDKQMWAYKENDCHRLIFFDATHTVQFAEFSGNCSQN